MAVIVLVALAAALRLYHIDFYDLRGDEAFSISLGQNSWADVIQFLRTGEPHPPFYYLGLKAWTMIAGQSELAARLPSAAAGIVLTPLVFAVGRRVGAPAAGLVAAIIVTFNPYLVWNSQDARMYALVATFCTAVLYSGVRMVGVGRPPRDRDALGLVAASVLALYTHYVAAVFVLAVLGVIGLRWLARYRTASRSLHLWSLSVGAIVVLYLPWLVLGLSVLGPSYAGSMYSPDLVSATLDVLRTFAVGERPGALAAGWAGPALALFTIVGAIVLLRRQPMVAMLAIAGMGISFGALLVASITRPVFSARYLLTIAPASYLLAAQGLTVLEQVRMIGRDRSTLIWRVIVWTIIAVAAAASILFMASALYGYYGNPVRGGWSAPVGELVRSAAREDLIIVNHPDPSFPYYYRKLGGKAQATVQPSRPEASDEVLDRELGGLMPPGRIIWFLPDDSQLWDKTGLVAAWLTRHTVRRAAPKIAGLDVQQYRVPAGVRQAIVFGGSLVLEGFELRGNKTVFVPGEAASIDLVWRAATRVTDDFNVSLQLLDEFGRLAAQSDGPPASGGAPTSSWRVTETLVDSRTVRMPDKNGLYTLGLAVYGLPSLHRLLVAGSPTNLATLGTLNVTSR